MNGPEDLAEREAARLRADALYGAPLLLASFLLFLSEPLAAKELLPLFGGSSSVWISALLFFQLDLLLGYAYARLLTRMVPRRAAKVHLVVLCAACVAAIAVALVRPASLATAATGLIAVPLWGVLALLFVRIGLPFLLLASASPLLQVWHSRSTGGPLPYRWYGLANLGAIAALLAYPLLLEPWLSLRLQRWLWTAGLLLFALVSALLTRQQAGATRPLAETARVIPSPLRSRALWFLLPMAGTLQLSAVTAHLTVNVAAMPLLWTLPLGAYLLSYVLAFERPQWYRQGLVVRLMVVLLASLGYLLSKTDVALPLWLAIAFFTIELLVACLFLHGETYRLRPADSDAATAFFLTVAAGGATGTMLVAVVSPLVFAGNYDLPLAFLITAVAALAVTWREGWPQRLLWSVSTALLLGLALLVQRASTRDTLLQARNFYGALRVKEVVTARGAAPVRTLLHGTIQHGTERFDGSSRPEPTTYYAPESGIGLVLRAPGQPRNVGVVGLGAGTLAAYGRPNDSYTFFELNPLIAPIARNLFTYLRSSPARIDIVQGDARASLQRSTDRFDVLAIDAFSGDAIPLHLLTTEAMSVYLRHLRPGGVIAFHVSNQYVDLAPEIVRLAEAHHLTALAVSNAANAETGAFAATWVLVGSIERLGAIPDLAERSHTVSAARVPLWTDEYSSLLPLLR